MSPDLSAISPHAVMRYMERVLKLAVAPEMWTIHDRGERMNAALMACRAHGLTVDQVRTLMIGEAPMIAAILAAGFSDTKVIVGEFAYVFRTGRMVTVVNKWMHDETAKHLHSKERDRTESRREMHKAQRRYRKKAMADFRRQREEA